MSYASSGMMFETHENRTETLTAAELPRWPFIALCAYILSHAFAIPLLAIGPSWAVWPTLSDFALVFLATSCLFYASSMSFVVGAQWKVCIWMAAAFLACLISLACSMAWLAPMPGSKALVFGVFQFLRFVAVLAVFWATSRIALTPARHTVLRGVTGFTLLLAAGGVFATSFDLIPPEVLTAHLPSDLDTAGPWHFYSLGEPARGWGALSYNRACVSAQLLMLLALHLRFADQGSSFPRVAAMGVTLGACFFSGSRAGLAAAGALMLLMARPRETLVLLVAAVAVGAYWTRSEQVPADLVELSEGHAALMNPAAESSLNGRLELWEEHSAFLKDHPVLVLTGAGFGSVADLVDNAHCMPLQILMELGILGLVAWMALVASALVYLHRHEAGTRVIFYATIALLVTSLTQETFYPIPAMGRFLDLYCCAFALALSGPPLAVEVEHD
jgi:hypothetical protein